MKKKYTTPECEQLHIIENSAVLFNNSLGATEPFGKEDDFENEDFDWGRDWETDTKREKVKRKDTWIRRKSMFED